MAVIVNFDLKTSRGEPYTALDKVIRLRREKLHETAEDAVVATMITVLRSIRAATMVAKPMRFKAQFGTTSNWFAGWATIGGKRRQVVRLGDPHGPRLTGANVVPLLAPGEKDGMVFVVSDAPPNMPKTQHDNYVVIAKDQGTALKYAKMRHAKRVKRYMGLARWTVAQAQGMVSTRTSPAGLGFAPSGKVMTVAIKSLRKRVTRTASAYAIDVADTLRYAVAAIEGGQAGIEMAMRRAANSTTGMIRKRWGAEHPFHDLRDLETPFPEISKHGG